ncbi:hypothetical protein OMDBNIEC_00064 [Salmonella phage STP-SP5]|nr:hypothetical protein OMDBNIEC_00064 [Salmonella phage STP-SP5]
MNWTNIFQYNDGKLYWKISPNPRILIGDPSGYLRSDGYLAIEYNGKVYKAHRIVWEMFNGPIPEGMEIDHIWHDRQDNRIENLRLVLKHDNSKNRSMNVNNTSGVTGVCWDKRSAKWLAQITVKGRTIHLGYFNDFELAVKARKQAEVEHKFHRNHGKVKDDKNNSY